MAHVSPELMARINLTVEREIAALRSEQQSVGLYTRTEDGVRTLTANTSGHYS
jgi:hypothetical protein